MVAPADSEDAAGSVVPACDSRDQVGEFLKAWKLRVVNGARILQEQDAALSTKCLGEGGELSLIELPEVASETGILNDRVVLIQWLFPENRTGRLVHLDEATSEVLFSMPTHHPNKKWETAKIVHPAIGVHMKKKRQPMPQDIIDLRDMWELALRARHDDEEEGGTFAACDICKRNDETCRRCALCLLTLHDHCGRGSLNVLDKTGDFPKLEFELKHDIDAGLCPCCRRWTSRRAVAPAHAVESEAVAEASCCCCSCSLSQLL